MKKFVSVLLSLLLLLGIFPPISFAGSSDCSIGSWEYKEFSYNGETGIELVKYKGYAADVYVPGVLSDGNVTYNVLKLGDGLFENNEYINSATLGNGIKIIGNSAFKNALNLVCIVTNTEIAEIGDNAFNGCSVFNSVIIYDSVKKIGDGAFSNCPGLTIYCNENNTGHGYAVANEIPYVLISEDAQPEIVDVDGITYYISNGEVTLMSCETSKKGTVRILSELNGFPVTKINNYAFKSCSISEVFIPDTITFIGKEVFRGCHGLTKANIPNSIEKVPYEMFYECPLLNNITIPYGITAIEGGAFEFCYDLTNISIPETVVSIGDYAFNYCWDLYKIEIPKGVTYLGSGALKNTSISKITLPEGITEIRESLFYCCKYLSSVVIPSGVTSIGSCAFMECSRLSSVTIPEGVKSFGQRAFQECTSLGSIVIPEGTETLGNIVFYGCTALKSVTLPVTLKDMTRNTAFMNCPGITDVYYNGSRAQWNDIPDIQESELYKKNVHFAVPTAVEGVSLNVSELELYAGTYGSLTPVFNPIQPDNQNVSWESSDLSVATVSNGRVDAISEGTAVITVTTEEGGFSAQCTVKVTTPHGTSGNITWNISSDNVLYINGTGAMLNYNSGTAPWYSLRQLIKKIIIADTITSVGNYAFYGLNSVNECLLPKSIGSLGYDAFNGCSSLKGISLPEGITYLPSSCFENCSSLAEITIPDSVTSFGYDVFRSSGLKTINFGNGLRTVELDAFRECYLSKVCVKSMDIWMNINFKYSTSNPLRCGSPLLYCGGEPVYDCVVPEGTYSIGNRFSGYKYLRSITMPDTVTSLGDSAFHNCYALQEVKLSSGLKTIPTYAFYGCSSLKSIVIPDSVTYIADSVFSKCSSLESVVLSKNLKRINSTAFSSCTSLKAIEIPESITTVGNNIFDGCTKLESVVVPGNVMIESGNAMFVRCSGLKKVVIKDGTTMIPSGMFSNCSSLSEVVLPEGLTKISDNAFTGCLNLAKINLPDSVEQIGNRVFYRCILSSCNMPKNLKSIGESAFYGSLLTDIELPASLLTIGDRAFAASENLKSVILPEGLQTISLGAFANTNLSRMVIPKSVTSIGQSVFSNDNILLFVYKDSVGHQYAIENNIPFFIIKETKNPEISYGTEIYGAVKYTDKTSAQEATVELLYDTGEVKDTVLTDENGIYNFKYAEVGRYTVRATDKSGNVGLSSVSIKRKNAFDVFLAGEPNITLKKSFNVSGTILPYEDATVTISDENGNKLESVNADSNGHYIISNVSNGNYILKGENKNGTDVKEITVFNSDVEVNFYMEGQSASVSGKVVDEQNQPKVWAQLSLYNEKGVMVSSAKSDENGEYKFDGLSNGNYAIIAEATVVKPGRYGSQTVVNIYGYAYVEITESREYVADIIVLKEKSDSVASLTGKIRDLDEKTYSGQVILANVFNFQLSYCRAKSDGIYSFYNLHDGIYFITAITGQNGVGFALVAIIDGNVFGNPDAIIFKSEKSQLHEGRINEYWNDRAEIGNYKKEIAEEKRFYDGLSKREKNELSQEYKERLGELISLINGCGINSPDGVSVSGVETAVEGGEIENGKDIDFTLNITKSQGCEIGESGVNTDEEFMQKTMEEIADGREIADYYDITFQKDGETIKNISKDTDTTGNIRITMQIPDEYKGHKHYSFIHMHNGVPSTLVDLDDNPDTVTFETDRFSTFALVFDDNKTTDEITYPASITASGMNKISVSSSVEGTLYISDIIGGALNSVKEYKLNAGTNGVEYDIPEGGRAFIWNADFQPLCPGFKN